MLHEDPIELNIKIHKRCFCTRYIMLIIQEIILIKSILAEKYSEKK